MPRHRVRPALPERFIFMVKIAHLATVAMQSMEKLAHFAAGHLDQREVALLAEQLRRPPAERNGLPTAFRYSSRLCTIVRRNVRSSRVAGRMSALSPVWAPGADFEAYRMQNVALLAIGVMQ